MAHLSQGRGRRFVLLANLSSLYKLVFVRRDILDLEFRLIDDEWRMK